MARGIFVTGTDTGVGKTLISCALIESLVDKGFKVVGMKPVASGSELLPEGLRNEDARALQQVANVVTDYSLINPYCFAPAIAPHLAARQVGQSIDLARLLDAYGQLEKLADIVVVEGAGGWRVPSEPTGYLSDFPEALNLDVILVVGLRLGCLNHALLTAQAIQSGPCRLIGWVGNQLEPVFPEIDANIQTLVRHLEVPCLGIIPYTEPLRVEEVAKRLRIEVIQN